MDNVCMITLEAVESKTLSSIKCLGRLTNIPVFTFFPQTLRLTRTMLGMLDWLSFNWMSTKLEASNMEFKVTLTFTTTSEQE